jgi:hypothetical protein
MKIEDVRQLTPIEIFLYWLRERHAIYLRRQAGMPKPWTDDEILQNNRFTNPYRENDKTTVWFRTNVRDPLRDDPAVILATVIFRWFNFVPTAEVLMGGTSNLLLDWSEAEALARLSPIRESGGQVFTGAYMVNSPPGKPKLEEICRRITAVWKRGDFLRRRADWPRMQLAHEDLLRFEGLGGFGAYEIVCDLRFTRFLEHATDKLIWCNPGPGAVRGLYRVLGRVLTNKGNASCPPIPKDWEPQTRKLLAIAQRELADLPPFEMREIEMSLCEVDKYIRLLLGEGKSKRSYDGGPDASPEPGRPGAFPVRRSSRRSPPSANARRAGSGADSTA